MSEHKPESAMPKQKLGPKLVMLEHKPVMPERKSEPAMLEQKLDPELVMLKHKLEPAMLE